MADEPAEAHGGPWPVQGTLTSADRQLIYDELGVSATVRWRVQWDQRCLTVKGPVNQLAAAKARALELISQRPRPLPPLPSPWVARPQVKVPCGQGGGQGQEGKGKEGKAPPANPPVLTAAGHA